MNGYKRYDDYKTILQNTFFDNGIDFFIYFIK
jgi:hypothetical protein